MITVAEYMMGRDVSHALECSPGILRNAARTVEIINDLLVRAKAAGVTIRQRQDGTLVNSGWRPPSLNARTPGASATSLHTSAEAVDLHDPNGAIARWCMASTHSTLADLGLWIEHPDFTPGWCHLQTRPPRSGSRVFVPR